MPLFHFHIRSSTGVVRDDEGTELSDWDAARNYAEESARELIADAIRAHEDVDGRVIEIADEDGTVIGTFALRDVLKR